MDGLSRWHETSERARFAKLRREMVEFQLRRRGIGDARVLAVMGEVPREEFLPSGLRNAAYDDDALPIGFGQTISQPYTVASMLEALQLSGEEIALEVGTGSGYAAAVLSRLVRVVHSVERVPELAQQARERLEGLGYANVFVHVANGTLGLAEQAPFDAIVVTAGAAKLPQPYQQQLAEGGRIVIPIGQETSQVLYRYTKCGSRMETEALGEYAFVPLIGEHGWPERRGN